MQNKDELKERLEFREAALAEARKAYLEITKGQAKSYAVGSRQITKQNLSELYDLILAMEKEIDSLKACLNGQKPRKSVCVIPRDL